MRRYRQFFLPALAGYAAAIASGTATFVLVPMILYASFPSAFGIAVCGLIAAMAFVVFALPALLVWWAAIRFNRFRFGFFLSAALVLSAVATCLVVSPSEDYEPVQRSYIENLLSTLPIVMTCGAVAACAFWAIVRKRKPS